MILNVLLGLILLAVLLAWLRWRRSSRGVLALALIVLLAAGCGPLPIGLLGALQAEHAVNAPVSWGQRNAIVLLGAGTVRVTGSGQLEPSLFAYGRIVEAAALYRSCRQAGRQCRLEVSGGDVRGLGQPEAAIYAADLQRLGVDAGDLWLESRSMNTWQNAQFSAPLLKAWGADRVLLVSSGFHLRRGMLYFAHFGIRAAPVRADYVSGVLSWLPLSYNLGMTDLALHEYAGIARYHLYNAMGWNVQATRPGSLQLDPFPIHAWAPGKRSPAMRRRAGNALRLFDQESRAAGNARPTRAGAAGIRAAQKALSIEARSITKR